MRNRQAALLFLTNLILFFTGSGLFPLLPLYAARFESSQTMIGIFLASLSAMNAVGALLASRLLNRFAPKRLLIVASIIGVPALLVLSQATIFWLVMASTAMLWFSGGVVGALLNVLTGLGVEAEERGRAFSLLFLAAPIATILGGTAVGALVSRFGYAPSFSVMAAIWGIIPFLGLFLPGAPQTAATGPGEAESGRRTAAPDRSFYVLLISVLAATAAIQMANLGAILGMQSARFSAAAISSTTVVSGVVTIPVVLFAGRLSDRVGRPTLLLLSYLLVALTVVPLAAAAQLWHFSAGIALLLVAMSVVRPLAAALATDLLEPAALARSLPLLEAGIMGVGIIASAGTGYLLESFGPLAVGLLAVILAVIAGGTLALLSSSGAKGRAWVRPTLRFFKRRAVAEG